MLGGVDAAASPWRTSSTTLQMASTANPGLIEIKMVAAAQVGDMRGMKGCRQPLSRRDHSPAFLVVCAGYRCPRLVGAYSLGVSSRSYVAVTNNQVTMPKPRLGGRRKAIVNRCKKNRRYPSENDVPDDTFDKAP
jgi:hypothetical protein